MKDSNFCNSLAVCMHLIFRFFLVHTDILNDKHFGVTILSEKMSKIERPNDSTHRNRPLVTVCGYGSTGQQHVLNGMLVGKVSLRKD